MDEQATKDAAAKQRVITHMNNDHHDSVVRYLEHYNKLSAWTAYSGKITDITLSEMTMECDAGSYKYAFEPPMTSFRDARERLVSMDKECVIALGRSDITVREWPLFKGGKEWGFFLSCVGVFLLYSRASFLEPDGIFGFLPTSFRVYAANARLWVVGLLVGVHAIEMVFLAKTRLIKHNVNPRSPVFWTWLAECAIQGVGSFKRFDRFVYKQQKAREGLKH